MALTLQEAQFYRDNFNVDEGLPATEGTMGSRAARAAGFLQNENNEKFNSGLISREEWRAGNREIEAFKEKVVSGDSAAIHLAGQLWYENEALPAIENQRTQGSGGGGGQPSQPESVPTTFMEAAKNRPAPSTRQPEYPVIGSGGLVDLGGGMPANNGAQTDDANKLIFTPTVNVARAPGLLASSNPQLYKLDAPTVRLPVNY